jgi:dipeptidyl aminopeptidase/acylaminoacyl peptidase
VGDPSKDVDFLWSRSPLSRAADIRVPLLIAQGVNDPRVKQAESEQIVAALKEAGIDYEYMLFPDEGHGFAKPENRLRFYAAAERFLARHLGGRAEE